VSLSCGACDQADSRGRSVPSRRPNSSLVVPLTRRPVGSDSILDHESWPRPGRIFSLSFSSFPMAHVVALSMHVVVAVHASVIRLLTLFRIPRLCRRFHLDAARFAELVPGDSSGLLVDTYNNQPRTMWIQIAALGMQNSRACPMYSHMRRYMAYRKRVNQNTAVLWPTTLFPQMRHRWLLPGWLGGPW
jgi:hypothetical protein